MPPTSEPPVVNPTRRRLLVLTAAGVPALSGCFFGDTRDDSELALHFESVPAGELGSEFLYTREEWTPAQRAFLDRGVSNATEAFGHRPFESGAVVRVNDTYFTASVSENGTGQVSRPVLVAEPEPEPSGRTGEFAGLAQSDVFALRCAIVSAQREGPEPCVLHGGDHSAFVPEPPFRSIEHNDEYFGLSVVESELELTRYAYEFQAVAENRSAFASYAAREMLAVDYDAVPLTVEEREILRTAADDGVYRESPPPYSGAFLDVVEAFRDGATDHRDYVKFDGEHYIAWTTEFSDD